MSTNISHIRLLFGGRLIGSNRMKNIVCRAVACLPGEQVDFVTRQVWFLSSPDDSWAYTFRGSDVAGQHLVVLSDDLFRQPESRIIFTVLHELGHVLLGHRNSMGYRQSKAEIKSQEQEADAFAMKYFSFFLT